MTRVLNLATGEITTYGSLRARYGETPRYVGRITLDGGRAWECGGWTWVAVLELPRPGAC